MVIQTIATIATDHIDLVSSKSFEDTARDLAALLGQSGTQDLMDRLAGAADWDDYAAECDDLGGAGTLFQVGFLDWGGVLSLSGVPMKAQCFIIGNPVTAQTLLAAGGPMLGLYLPVKMLVYEARDGTAHIAYDQLPLMAPSENDGLSVVTSAIDAALKELAWAAAGWL